MTSEEQIVEVIRRGINDLNHDRVEDGILHALREAGLVVVPEEPTEAMLKAPRSSAVLSELRNLRQDYKAMIAAYIGVAQDGEYESEVGLDDVLAWADGIMGAQGTEYASRVTDEEALVAHAIFEAYREMRLGEDQ